MDNVLTQIFLTAGEINDFRKTVLSLNGDFPFDCASMMDLGKAYFDRYPDRFSNRNTEEVLLGYALVRICSVEKMVETFPADKKDGYRGIFSDVSRTEGSVRSLVAVYGRESVLQDYRHLDEKLKAIKETVDEIPRGMIKERFIGGISSLFNILYVLKMNIEKSDAG